MEGVLVPMKSSPLLPLGNSGRERREKVPRHISSSGWFRRLGKHAVRLQGHDTSERAAEGRKGERLNATSQCLPTDFYKTAVLITGANRVQEEAEIKDMLRD